MFLDDEQRDIKILRSQRADEIEMGVGCRPGPIGLLLPNSGYKNIKFAFAFVHNG